MVYISDNLINKAKNRGMELFSILMADYIRDNLRTISKMEKDFNNFQMGPNMKEHLKEALKVEKEHFFGSMTKFIKVNG
jgi:hypothetical protein